MRCMASKARRPPCMRYQRCLVIHSGFLGPNPAMLELRGARASSAIFRCSGASISSLISVRMRAISCGQRRAPAVPRSRISVWVWDACSSSRSRGCRQDRPRLVEHPPRRWSLASARRKPVRGFQSREVVLKPKIDQEVTSKTVGGLSGELNPFEPMLGARMG